MTISPDNYSDSSSFNTGFYVPVLIALVGAVIGAVGIFMAIQAQGAVSAMEETLKGRERLYEEIKTELQETDKRLVALTARVQQIAQQNPGNQILEQIRPVFENYERRIQTSEQGVNAIVEQLQKLAPVIEELDRRTTELAQGRGRSSASAATSTSSTAVTQTGGGAQVYRIQRGDTFSGIAERHGISLRALIQANPNTDPNRIQVGQEIVIPAQ